MGSAILSDERVSNKTTRRIGSLIKDRDQIDAFWTILEKPLMNMFVVGALSDCGDVVSAIRFGGGMVRLR